MCDCNCNCSCHPSEPKPFDPSKPVQLRDGRKAVILGEIPNHCIQGRVLIGYAAAHPNRKKPDSFDHFMWHPETGKASSDGELPYDLVNVVERTSKWSNVYPDAGGYVGISGYADRDEAIRNSTFERCLGQMEWVIEDGVIVDVVFHKKEVCPCA